MYAQYKSHDDATLSYMEDTLCHFHTFKEVFLLDQAGKQPKAKPNALRTELVKQRKLVKETYAEMWMLSKKWSEMNTCRDYPTHELDVAKEFNSDFNCPKIQFMSRWVKQSL